MTLTPSSDFVVGLMKIQPATKMFNLMFSNRISTKFSGASGYWSPSPWALFFNLSNSTMVKLMMLIYILNSLLYYQMTNY